jgi:WD40 repeat protein
VLILMSALALAAAQKLPPPLQELVADASQEYASAAFSPKGGVLAAGANGVVRILTIPDRGKVGEAKVLKQRGRVDELLFDAAGGVLVSRSRDQEALVWQTDTWAPVKFALEDAAFFGPAMPLPASSLVLADRSRGMRLWGVDGLARKPRAVVQKEVREWGGVGLGHVTSVAGAESTLLLGDDQGYLYRLPDPSRIFGELPVTPQVGSIVPQSAARALLFRPHAGEISSIGLAVKAGRCVTSGMDGKVRLWDLSTIPPTAPNGRPVALAPQWEIDGQAAELSVDGKLLAVANGDGVAVYVAASGTMLSWNPTAASGGRVVRLKFDGAGKALAAIVCRCAECGPANRVELIRLKRRLVDHGGGLVLWR